ncbi:MAG: tetratricopeptide repeat protein [Opitutales bacterium]
MKYLRQFLLFVEGEIAMFWAAQKARFSWVPKWVAVTFAGLAVLGVIGLAGLALSWNSIREYRSAQLMNEAEQLESAGQGEAAAKKAEAAFRLDVHAAEPVRFLYEHYRDHHPVAIDWLEQVIIREGHNQENVMALIDLHLQHGDVNDIKALVLQMAQIAPDDPNVQLAKVRIAMREHRHEDALELLLGLSDAAPDSAEVHETLFEVLMRSGSKPLMEDARVKWQSFVSDTERLGLVALRNLVRSTPRDAPELADWMRQIREHPLRSKQDVLAAVTWQHANESLSWDEARAEVEAELDLNDPDDLTLWAYWLAGQKKSGLILETVPAEQLADNPRLGWEYMLAYIEHKDAQEARDFMSRMGRDQLGLSNAQFEYLQLLIGSASEANDGISEQRLRYTLQGSSPLDWALIERDLRLRGEDRALELLFERQAQFRAAPSIGKAALLRQAYQQGDTDRIEQMLRRFRISEFAEVSPAVAWFAGYLRILLRIDLDTLRAELREVATDYPTHPTFQNIYALSFAVEGDHARAGRAAAPLRGPITERPAFLSMAVFMLYAESTGQRPPQEALDLVEPYLKLDQEVRLLQQMRQLAEPTAAVGPTRNP